MKKCSACVIFLFLYVVHSFQPRALSSRIPKVHHTGSSSRFEKPRPPVTGTFSATEAADRERKILLSNDEQDVDVEQMEEMMGNSLELRAGRNDLSKSDVRSSPFATEAVLQFRATTYDLVQAAVVGVVSGLSVALFKLSIEAVREICYSQGYLATMPYLMALIPAFGGLVVGGLMLVGPFPPGLKGTVKEVDDDSTSPVRDLMSQVRTQLTFIRKSAAAVFTLGTGCSLGPEGPCVEIGMSVARACMDIKARAAPRTNWNRLLLSCGAAAGVAAGFNAPLAGVFFAIEVVQNSFVAVRQETGTGPGSVGDAASMLSTSAAITPVLLASVLSALIARTILGNHLVLSLTEYSLKTPLVELPLYLLLGALSGFVAFAFSRLAKLSKSFFDGEIGPEVIRGSVLSLPASVKPIVGGFLCGFAGLFYPQILFFGYETLNNLLANNSLPTSLTLILLSVKMVMTAVAAGSGLVGGTFAPSLFFGAMTGASFHNIVSAFFQIIMYTVAVPGVDGPVLQLADIPAYAMVGAASVLAALFRAPLTASLLLFEVTRDYDVLLPLMASAGVGSIVGDILDNRFDRTHPERRRDNDAVSWGDLADQTQDTTDESTTSD